MVYSDLLLYLIFVHWIRLVYQAPRPGLNAHHINARVLMIKNYILFKLINVDVISCFATSVAIKL